MEDIREKIFSLCGNAVVTAGIYAEADGVVAGISRACAQAAAIGLNVDYSVTDGNEIFCHDLIMRFSGTPVQICEAEDTLISEISKYSGVATAAKAFVNAAANTEIVCGSWKKMPKEIKSKLRDAITLGGASVRICKDPMVYLDKNYVAILGGIQKALMAVKDISDRKKAIQVKGRYENGDIVREALTAVYSGADIIYVDTGNIRDLQSISVAVRTALSELGSELGTERNVKIAFGGGVTLAQVPDICAAGADIIGVGRAIIDAPLLDLKLEVANIENPENAHSQYDLFHKHELTITGIHLKDTNLSELSNIVADVIGIDRADVLVIDVRYDYVSLDILRSRIDPEKFVSKEETLLNALSRLTGVELDDNAGIVSNGMLGWIAGDNKSLESSRLEITRSKELAEEIRHNISHRVIVFPTGAEVESGEIVDTNTPLITEKLTEAGFTVDKGEVLKDDLTSFSAKLRKAAEQAYGVCITTGGVGAENKDYSVEAIQILDPNACTPYIAKFETGHGRHSKDGIRIGVGQEGMTTFIALPGPNDEVALCIDTVVEGLRKNWGKELLAYSLAELLRERLKEKLSWHLESGDKHKHNSNLERRS